MTNRLLQIRYGKQTEAYHLFALVQYKKRLYFVYANRGESPERKLACARRSGRGWRLWQDELALLEVEDLLQPLLDAADPLAPCRVYRLTDADGLQLLGQRFRPFLLRESGWSLPVLLAAWLALSLAVGWLAVEHWPLRGWVLAAVPGLTRAQADGVIRLGVPALSLPLVWAGGGSLLSLLGGVAGALCLLILPGVVRLGSVWLTCCLAALLLMGLGLCADEWRRARSQPLPSRRRRQQRMGTALLDVCLLGAAVLCYGMVLPNLDPPAIVTAAQPGDEADAPQTAEEARTQYAAQVLPRLNEETWEQLTLQQRADLLQQVVDYEAAWELHCSTLPVEVRVTDTAVTLAYYDGLAIVIDRDNLQNRALGKVIQSALHELRHHYQYQVAAMLAAVEETLPQYAELAYFDAARLYVENMDDYVNSAEDPQGYYYQVMERDARYFAEDRYEGFYQPWVEPETLGETVG